jgi:hypothetical protein
LKSISKTHAEAKERYEQKVGQKVQDKFAPVREGVILIAPHHTADDLMKLGQKLEQKFGIKTIQVYCHKDEGHYEKETGKWKANLHGHMVFDWTDHQSGKAVRLNKMDMSKMQTLIADELGLERGEKSDKKHLNSLQFKIKQEEENLKGVYNLDKGLSQAFSIIKQSEGLEKEFGELTRQKNMVFEDVEQSLKMFQRELLRIERDMEQMERKHDWTKSHYMQKAKTLHLEKIQTQKKDLELAASKIQEVKQKPPQVEQNIPLHLRDYTADQSEQKSRGIRR